MPHQRRLCASSAWSVVRPCSGHDHKGCLSTGFRLPWARSTLRSKRISKNMFMLMPQSNGTRQQATGSVCSNGPRTHNCLGDERLIRFNHGRSRQCPYRVMRCLWRKQSSTQRLPAVTSLENGEHAASGCALQGSSADGISQHGQEAEQHPQQGDLQWRNKLRSSFDEDEMTVPHHAEEDEGSDSGLFHDRSRRWISVFYWHGFL